MGLYLEQGARVTSYIASAAADVVVVVVGALARSQAGSPASAAPAIVVKARRGRRCQLTHRGREEEE